MELLQDIATGQIGIYSDGTNAANPGVYYNRTDSIGSWVKDGLPISDGKVVKAEVKRIVELEAGADLDAKFANLSSDAIKVLAAKELVFDLLPATVLTVLTQTEYDTALVYRKIESAQARASRWNLLLNNLAAPEVFANSGKFAFLIEELRKYERDYTEADNKILEAFINGDDHPYSQLQGYPRAVDFNTTPAISLDGLPLWDDQALGGPDAAYKTLVTDIIKDAIVNAAHYITA